MRKWRLSGFLAGLVLSAAVLPAGAQVLADRTPADAVVYAGWSGSDALGQSYDASHLKSFLNTLNLPQFLSETIQTEMGKQTDPQKVQDGKLITDWLAAMAKSPTAFYLGKVDFTNPRQPTPHMALFSKTGKETAAALAEKLNALLNRQNQPNVPVHGVHAVGDYLVIFIGEPTIEAGLGDATPAGALAASPAFKAAMAQVGGDSPKAAASVYLDIAGGLKLVGEAVKAQNNAEAAQYMPIILEGAGLNAMTQAAWSGAFDAADWRANTFVGMTGKRTGVAAFFDHPPLKDSTLAMIPQAATAAGVFRFDNNQLMADMQDMAKQINERAPQQLDLLFQQIFVFTGIDIKNDYMPAMGDEYVWYGSPAAGGNSLRGFTLINKLRDTKKAETAFTAIESFVNMMVQQRDPASKMVFRTDALPAPLDKVTAHVMALDFATPAWAIYNDTFYFSMSLAGLQSAIEQNGGATGTKPATSLLNNPTFVEMRKKIGQASIFSFSYGDLKASAPEAYEIYSRLLATAAQQNPGRMFSLPPLEKLMPDIGPSLEVSWSDKDGYHNRDTSPFPGSLYLSPSQLVTMRLMEMVNPNGRRTPGAGAPGGALP